MTWLQDLEELKGKCKVLFVEERVRDFKGLEVPRYLANSQHCYLSMAEHQLDCLCL